MGQPEKMCATLVDISGELLQKATISGRWQERVAAVMSASRGYVKNRYNGVFSSNLCA